MTGAPSLDEIGISGDVQKILEDAAKDAITEPKERWSRESNLVRMGKKQLPERVTVYRRLTGRAAELPTATIVQSMAKTAPDGGPVFVRTIGECTAQPPAFLESPVCNICAETTGKPKRFYKESNYRGHMRGFHGLEWEEIREQQERDERREEREVLRQAILQSKEAANAQKEFTCDDCGKGFDRKVALIGHQRTHKVS